MRRTVVVTSSVLGAAVKELAGEAFEVRVLIPDGLDVHAWEPPARDIESLSKADFIVQNGLGLEQTLAKAIDRAKATGRPVFTATDHITVRRAGADEVAEDHGDEEGHAVDDGHRHAREAGAPDPHFWTDPLAMDAVMGALARALETRFAVDLQARRHRQSEALKGLDAEIRKQAEALPPARRKMVTGHQSMGYFAERYGFTLIGAVIPGVSTSAESSAATMARLKALIRKHQVPAVFTETGTPQRAVDALARECGVRVVELPTHQVPEDGSYLSFVRTLASGVFKGLQ